MESIKKEITHMEEKLKQLKLELYNHPDNQNNEKNLIKKVIENLRKYCEKKNYKNYDNILEEIEENLDTAPRYMKYSVSIEGKYQNAHGELQACFYKYKGETVFFYNFDIDENYWVHDFTQDNYIESQWKDDLPNWIVNYLPNETVDIFRENVNYDTWDDDKDISKLLNNKVDKKTFIEILLADINEDEEEQLFNIGNEFVLFAGIATNYYLMDSDNISPITEEWIKKEEFYAKDIIENLQDAYDKKYNESSGDESSGDESE